MPIQTAEGTGPGSPHTTSLCAEPWVELRGCIYREEETGLDLALEAHSLVRDILEETDPAFGSLWPSEERENVFKVA